MPTLCRDCLEVNASDDAQRCTACGSRRLVRHQRLTELAVAHVDCDAFYAAIHKRDNPEWRAKPVIVGGGARGVVATCCYIARASGVRSAMPMFKALKACPDAVVVRPDMALYAREGRRVRDMMSALTPLVEPVSIDEAYLDLSGCARMHGAPPAIVLADFQARVERETGLTVSVGLSENKFLAKAASEMDKPRGFAALDRGDVAQRLWPLPARAMHGVGPAFAKALERHGLRTIGDIAASASERMERAFGEAGARLHALAWGRDDRLVRPDGARKSVSAETTFDRDLSDPDALRAVLARLSETVGRRARAAHVSGRVVVLKLRTAGFRSITRRLSLQQPTATGRVLLASAAPLLTAELGKGPFRLIGIGLSDLGPLEGSDAGDLMDKSGPRLAALERALDKVAAKWGPGAVRTGD